MLQNSLYGKQETRVSHIHETIRTLCWLVYVPKADATRLGELSGDANQLLAVSRKQLITVWSARGCHGNAAVARIHCQSSPLPY